MIFTPLPNSRYERKFVAEGCSVAEAIAAIKRHPAMFREVYPARIVNNIYLDTAELLAYHQHVNGAMDRVKTRIRWYGPLGGEIERPTLERKMKSGLVGGKLSFRLQPIHINGSVPRNAIDQVLGNANLPPPLHEDLHCMRPSLVNRYGRNYFLSGDGNIRLTVDSQIQFFGTRNSMPWSMPVRLRPAVVIELKFDTDHADEAAWITNRMPFRMGSFSKYVKGIQAVGRV